jgi:hypothetical protein
LLPLPTVFWYIKLTHNGWLTTPTQP